MEFLRSFLRHYFEEKLVVESLNVGCFLGLSRKKNELCWNPARFSVCSLCIALPYSDSTSYAGYQLFPQNQLTRGLYSRRIFIDMLHLSMAHAGNTKIWAKIISAYAKKCSITGFSSLRGGGGAKNASIYALSGHERIEKRSEKWSWCWQNI